MSGSSFSPFENDIGVVTEKWLLQVLWPGLKIWMVWVERVDGKGWHVAAGCLHAAFACCSHASTSTLQTHSYGGVWEHSHTCIILKCPGIWEAISCGWEKMINYTNWILSAGSSCSFIYLVGPTAMVSGDVLWTDKLTLRGWLLL